MQRTCPSAGPDKRRHDSRRRPGLASHDFGHRILAGNSIAGRRFADSIERAHTMGYGVGGILVLILVILAIIYFARRV